MAKAEKKALDEHRGWLQELGEFQESDLDQRQQARESDRFVLDKDGQWEESVARDLDSQKRPRYTFDQTTPAIEFVMSDIEAMEFGSIVKPASGEATKELALTLEGMIRSVEADSDADSIYRKACRRVVRRGFDAWIVKAKHKDEWSFDQDLVVEAIPNAINRVWLSNTSTEEDSSDSDVAYVLTSVSPKRYKEIFPQGKGISIDDQDLGEHWDQYRPEVIVFSERYYKKETKREVAQLSNGEVVELDEKFDKVKDEYAQQGITIKRQKTVKDYKIYHRFFDGGGMLSEERETVFDTMPVVTSYGNFELLGENSKITYHGMVLKEMDYQRVLNYAKSREVEEGALAPREKIWMTKKQAKGHAQQLSAMNVSADPVQFYNPDSEAPQPYKTPPSQINPHLSTLSADMAEGIRVTSGVNNAMSGEYAGRMSEDALKMQIERGTAATRKWVNALAKSIRRTSEILVRTIPRVYDTQRQFMLLGKDGSEEMTTLNQEMWDMQSQKMVRVNFLSQGKYKVFCDAGKSFTNQMEAGLNAMLRYAEIDPSIVQQGGDLMLKAIDAPLVDEMAARKRAMLLQQGVIPFDQMTDEEKAEMQAAQNQPQQPDANMVLAQAELTKGQADVMDAQTKQQEAQIKAFEAETKRQKVQVDAAEAGAKIKNTEVDTAKKMAETQGKSIDNAKSIMGG